MDTNFPLAMFRLERDLFGAVLLPDLNFEGLRIGVFHGEHSRLKDLVEHRSSIIGTTGGYLENPDALASATAALQELRLPRGWNVITGGPERSLWQQRPTRHWDQGAGWAIAAQEKSPVYRYRTGVANSLAQLRKGWWCNFEFVTHEEPVSFAATAKTPLLPRDGLRHDLATTYENGRRNLNLPFYGFWHGADLRRRYLPTRPLSLRPDEPAAELPNAVSGKVAPGKV